MIGINMGVPTHSNSRFVEFSPTRAVPTKNSPGTFCLASLQSCQHRKVVKPVVVSQEDYFPQQTLDNGWGGQWEGGGSLGCHNSGMPLPWSEYWPGLLPNVLPCTGQPHNRECQWCPGEPPEWEPPGVCRDTAVTSAALKGRLAWLGASGFCYVPVWGLFILFVAF